MSLGQCNAEVDSALCQRQQPLDFQEQLLAGFFCGYCVLPHESIQATLVHHHIKGPTAKLQSSPK
jgi:hypothetical protein